MKNESKISLLDIFLIFLKISTFTFGGGYTIVPVIRDEFSHKRKLIEKDEMLDITSIATSGPGPMAINASILTGYRLKGLAGGIVAAIAAALPPLIIITIISYFYKEFSENYYVKAALTGMGGVIAATLLITSYEMAKSALKTNTILGLIIMISAFIASYYLNINTGIIILFTGLLGLILFSIIKKEDVK